MIAIIGGGCSGLLVAAQLFRRDWPGEVALVELRERPGRGLAYSTPWSEHLLNVPAGRMSAYPDEPAHFVKWLQDNKIAGAGEHAFVPRSVYGDYLEQTLAATGKKFRHVRAEAIDVESDKSGVTFILSNGARLKADKAVLALGNRASQTVPGRVSAAARARCYESPWLEGALRVEPDSRERILIIGTGLTAIDAVLALEAQSPTVRVDLISRRGLVSQPHRAGLTQKIDPIVTGPIRLRALCREVRRQIKKLEAEGIDWRVAIDSLRPVSNDLWQQLDFEERRRFSRHLRPYWAIHRHRMAPEIEEKIARYQREGQMQVHAGRVVEIDTKGKWLEAKIALRGGKSLRLEADRVINCVGVEERYRDSVRPLIGQLLTKGFACVNEMGVGFSTDADGALVDKTGNVSSCLFAMGPTRSGALFETTAVPEIRVQAERVARRLIEG